MEHAITTVGEKGNTHQSMPPATTADVEKICDLEQQRETLLHALYTALPFVEDAIHDPCYKPRYVQEVERHIRGVLESIERAMKVPDARL